MKTSNKSLTGAQILDAATALRNVAKPSLGASCRLDRPESEPYIQHLGFPRPERGCAVKALTEGATIVGPGGSVIATCLITPNLASELLKYNVSNRPLSLGRWKRYAELMAKGQWGHCYDPIIISSEQQLINGQHRLTALVDAAVVLPFICVTQAPPRSFETTDRGKQRSPSDLLRENRNVTAAARCLVSLMHGVNKATPSVEDLAPVVEQYRAGLDWASRAINGRGLGTAAVRATFAAAFVNQPGYRDAVVELADNLVDCWHLRAETALPAARTIAQFINRPSADRLMHEARWMGSLAAGIEDHCLGRKRILLKESSNGSAFVLGTGR